MEMFIKRITNLLTVKSIITLTMLAVFAWLTIRSGSLSDEFFELFQLVVIFYFGTQAAKRESK